MGSGLLWASVTVAVGGAGGEAGVGGEVGELGAFIHDLTGGTEAERWGGGGRPLPGGDRRGVGRFQEVQSLPWPLQLPSVMVAARSWASTVRLMPLTAGPVGAGSGFRPQCTPELLLLVRGQGGSELAV